MSAARDLSFVTQTVVDPSAVPLAPQMARQPPLQIPDYRLIKQVGSGAFGEVWLAEEKHMPGVFRAVKVLRTTAGAGPTDSGSGDIALTLELRGLQLYETRARGHPHLVQVLRVGRINDSGNGGFGNGCVYYAMEIADHAGGAQPFTPEDYRPLTLRSLLRYGGRLPAERAIQNQLQLLDGLDHLHRNGLQHRDVKPANLLFVCGKLKLADLGLTSSDESHQTCGTVGYLPPESKEPDDLYAAGIVLYEMLTGFPASSFPEWPDDLDPTQNACLAELRKVMSRACDRDPQRRFADANSFRSALQLSSAPASGAQSHYASHRRAKRVAMFASGICVAAVITAAWLGYELRGARYGFSNGRPPYNGSIAKVYSEDHKFHFEWSVSSRRLAVPTNTDERHIELFDLQAKMNGSEFLLRGSIQGWSVGNPLPRRVEEATGKHGEIVQVFLVVKTDDVASVAEEVDGLSRDLQWSGGRAARDRQFDIRFPREIQLLLDTQLEARPGRINGFMLGIDLASLGLDAGKSYSVFAFVTAAETYEMYQTLATSITEDAGLRIGSVQHTPDAAAPGSTKP